MNFNPRSPCGERPAPPFASARPCRHFNPRSPCGERRVPVKASSTATGISIHAPLAGSDAVRQAIVDRVGISIHAPLAGSDPAGRPEIRRARFQSTLPLRGATHGFSIGQIQFPHFNPRSPCGERLVPRVCNAIIRIFQSTLPLRGATVSAGQRSDVEAISIHAPLAGSDPAGLWLHLCGKHFNPRSPCGERRGWP